VKRLLLDGLLGVSSCHVNESCYGAIPYAGIPSQFTLYLLLQHSVIALIPLRSHSAVIKVFHPVHSFCKGGTQPVVIMQVFFRRKSAHTPCLDIWVLVC
jgi:hypothetical protein